MVGQNSKQNRFRAKGAERAVMVTDGDKTAERRAQNGNCHHPQAGVSKGLFPKDRVWVKIGFVMAFRPFGALPTARLYWRTCTGSMQTTPNGDNVANGVPGENGDGHPKPQDIGVWRGERGQPRGKRRGR